VRYVVSVNGERIEVDVAPDGVRVGDEHLQARVDDVEGTPVRLVCVGDTVHRVIVRPGAMRGEYTLWIGGHRYVVEALDERTRTIRDMTGMGAGPSGPSPLIAPMPGLIVRVSVSPGDEVRAGQGMVVMEAMKMENELRAPADGRVKVVRVAPGQAVEKGALLVELE
jgi:acetyl/propionyl-CoA carboxylase alpha subunit